MSPDWDHEDSTIVRSADEHHDDFDEPPSKPLSFKGTLELSNFMFKSPETGEGSDALNLSDRPPVRRSPRSVAKKKRVEGSDGGSEEDKTEQDGQKKTTTTKKKAKRARTSSGYAPPSTYAHLPLLPDAIAENLLVLFIGLNPGLQTARTGHAYAHPSNLFWKLLFSSGVTPRLCAATEDRQMPALYALGLTNIVARPSRNGGELSKREMDDGVAALEDKARAWRPEAVCVVGKGIWESIWRVRHGGAAVGRAFRYGWQDETENMGVVPGEWPGARVFVATSTSGLAATLSPAEKQEVWDQLGSWVKRRRAERELEAERASKASTS